MPPLWETFIFSEWWLLMNHTWGIDDESYMRHWWVIHEALMSHTWGTVESYMRLWWVIHEASMSHTRDTDESYTRHWWVIHEALVNHTWGIGDSYMKHYKSWLQLKGGALPKMDDHMAVSSFTWDHLVRVAVLAAASRTPEVVLPKHMKAHVTPQHHLYDKQSYRRKSFSCLASILLLYDFSLFLYSSLLW